MTLIFLKKFELTQDEKEYEFKVAKTRASHYGSKAETSVPEAYWMARAYEESERQKGRRY